MRCVLDANGLVMFNCLMFLYLRFESLICGSWTSYVAGEKRMEAIPLFRVEGLRVLFLRLLSFLFERGVGRVRFRAFRRGA